MGLKVKIPFSLRRKESNYSVDVGLKHLKLLLSIFILLYTNIILYFYFQILAPYFNSIKQDFFRKKSAIQLDALNSFLYGPIRIYAYWIEDIKSKRV